MHANLIEAFRKRIIISCQALEDEPLYGAEHMAVMAKAAVIGGAAGIRANTPIDIRAIRQVTDLPIIGLYKVNYSDSEVFITPTLEEIKAVYAAGADIIALDATARLRPGGLSLQQLVTETRAELPDAPLMADVSTYEEGVEAMRLGFDLISTTMSGYTPYSKQQEGPDLELVARLSALKDKPVIAEGRYWQPEQCRAALKAGAYSVVVGSAITRPQEIAKRFTRYVEEAETGGQE